MTRFPKLLLLVVSFMPFTALAQTAAPRPAQAFAVPDDVSLRAVDIYSEGTRMAGDALVSKANAGKKLPTIVMAHGWGGNKNALRPEAVAFAQAGYFVVAFDYRGWGESDSRVILVNKREPAEKQNNRFTAEVQEVREVVEPLDMVIDWLNAINWAVGDPQCDPDHIGVWGSSLSGGLVVSVALADARVKALHSQVPSLDGRWTLSAQERATTEKEEVARARGELGYPAPRANTVQRLIGAPIRMQFAAWFPVEYVDHAPKVAMQFVVAEKEELMDNKDNGVLAYQRARGPKNLVTIPEITHYGVYMVPDVRKKVRDLAIAWFDKYLKGTATAQSARENASQPAVR
ncbi:MAG TPA: alpha/beta fold hydrolase [Candidatus Angelobacter sp.]|nr:alpha/beta fold hydrolase [Candidatus Angelobacter sp.]